MPHVQAKHIDDEEGTTIIIIIMSATAAPCLAFTIERPASGLIRLPAARSPMVIGLWKHIHNGMFHARWNNATYVTLPIITPTVVTAAGASFGRHDFKLWTTMEAAAALTEPWIGYVSDIVDMSPEMMTFRLVLWTPTRAAPSSLRTSRPCVCRPRNTPP